MKTPERRRNGTKEKHNILDHEEFRQKKKKKTHSKLKYIFLLPIPLQARFLKQQQNDMGYDIH